MYRDKCNKPVAVGDTVEIEKGKRTIQYIVRAIESYPIVTAIIAENVKTGQVDTLLLRDVKKV